MSVPAVQIDLDKIFSLEDYTAVKCSGLKINYSSVLQNMAENTELKTWKISNFLRLRRVMLFGILSMALQSKTTCTKTQNDYKYNKSPKIQRSVLK